MQVQPISTRALVGAFLRKRLFMSDCLLLSCQAFCNNCVRVHTVKWLTIEHVRGRLFCTCFYKKKKNSEFQHKAPSACQWLHANCTNNKHHFQPCAFPHYSPQLSSHGAYLFARMKFVYLKDNDKVGGKRKCKNVTFFMLSPIGITFFGPYYIY